MLNCDFWTRITSLYGSQTWPVILCMYNSVLNIRITSLYGTQPSSVVFARKPVWLASESLVSMGPSPHDWFLDAKQRLLDRNNKSLWVPNMTCRCVHEKQRDQHLNYLSLWVPALICGFCMQNSDFCTSIPVSMGSRPQLSLRAYKTAWLAPELLVSMGSSLHLWFFAFKTATLEEKLQVSMGPRPHMWFSACKTATLRPKSHVSMVPRPR